MRTDPINNIGSDGLHRDTALYEDSHFISFIQPYLVDERIEEYREEALALAENEPCDRIVIYAVLEYDEARSTLISADLMCKSVPYEKYVELASKLINSCRLFFFRGRKEIDNE